MYTVQVQQDGGGKDFNKLPQLHLPLTRPQDQGTLFIYLCIYPVIHFLLSSCAVHPTIYPCSYLLPH